MGAIENSSKFRPLWVDLGDLASLTSLTLRAGVWPVPVFRQFGPPRRPSGARRGAGAAQQVTVYPLRDLVGRRGEARGWRGVGEILGGWDRWVTSVFFEIDWAGWLDKWTMVDRCRTR